MTTAARQWSALYGEHWLKLGPSYSLSIEIPTVFGSPLSLHVSDGLQGCFSVPGHDGVIAAVWEGLFVLRDIKGEHFPRECGEEMIRNGICAYYMECHGVIPSLSE